MIGTLSSIENHGSIVIVWLDLDDGRSEPIYMDHRAFGWLVDGESIETVDDLIGRMVEFDGECIKFLDKMEVA
jgi:hypothetical protein